MKPGSIVMFNDYDANGGYFPGVKKAVEEYANKQKVVLNCCAGGGNAWVELPK
jgi:hypothetical protein